MAHGYDERLFDTGELELNYATTGDASRQALLLIPGQTESWWGYEPALHLLGELGEVGADALECVGCDRLVLHASSVPGWPDDPSSRATPLPVDS